MLAILSSLIESVSTLPNPWPLVRELLAPTATVTSTATAVPPTVPPTAIPTAIPTSIPTATALPTIAPTVVPTATAVVTPTAAVTSTVIPPTAVPTPTPVPTPPPWESGGWLADTGWTMLYHVPLLLVFILLGVAALVLYFYFSRRRYAGHTLNARLTEFLAGILGAASVLGLLFLLCAYFAVPFLSMPVWLLVLIVALLGFAGYCIWYYFQRYPARLAAYEREVVKQRYMPTARERTKTTTPSKPPKPLPPGQRKRKKRKKR